MVIAKTRLDEVVPLEPASMPGRLVVQWDKDDCADLGIIKVDLLGLGMMAVLEQAVPLVRTHEGIDVDLAQLPPGDPSVYELLQKADTVGVFQVESRAQMATLPRMRPTCFYDIVVEGVSLVMTYRSEFDAVVKQEGIDGLIKRLAQKNTPAAVGGSASKPDKK